MVIACLMTVLAMAACNNPAQNEGVVSLNLQGPVQLNHRSVIDEGTGVLISSEVDATANLTGNVHKIPPELLEAVPENLRSLAGVEVGMDASWTVTEELAGGVPERSAFESIAPKALIGVGFALLALALVLSLRRRKSRQPEDTPEPEEASPSPLP